MSKARKSAKKSVARTHHHGDLKQTLVRVALEYLREGTAVELSLRELARRAGVSQAAPYRHFTDKDHLLSVVAADGFQKLGDYMKEAIVSHPEDAKHQFYQACQGYLRMALEYPEHFKLITGAAIPQEFFFETKELYFAGQRSFYLLVRLILNCQKQNLIGAGCPVRRALHCWSTVHGFSALYSLGRLGWLGVDPSTAESALRGLSQNLLKSLQFSDSDMELPFLPHPTPIALSVLKEIGLEPSELAADHIMTFDDQKEWPDLNALAAGRLGPHSA